MTFNALYTKACFIPVTFLLLCFYYPIMCLQAVAAAKYIERRILMEYTCTDECPYIKDTYSIYIHYTYVPVLRSQSSNYKKTSFECELEEECPYQDNCPVYQKAPVVITG